MTDACPADASQQRAARVAGAAFLLAIVLVIVANYGINFRLIIPGNAVDTARNLQAHGTLFRLNVACNLAYVATLLVLLTALLRVLEPVDRDLARMAALGRLVTALMWGITALNSLSALRFLGDAAYLSAFQVGQLQALTRLQLAGSYDAYYVGLPFWGLASTLCCWLWFRSRYIPRGLALVGLVSSAWCVACAFAFLVFPAFATVVNASWFDVPLVLFELVLGGWLLAKGLKRTVKEQTDPGMP